MPFFLSAKVTKGYKADSKQFKDLLKKTDGIEIGEESLDRGYLARAIAQLIANMGAHPYIALKENTSSALSHGYPAWNSMVHEAWEHKEGGVREALPPKVCRRGSLQRLQGEVREGGRLED